MATLRELEQDLLARTMREVLESQRYVLCNDLDPTHHFPYLRSTQVLTHQEQQLISNIQRSENTSAACGKFLDIVASKTNGFRELCKSLELDGTQPHLLEALNKALETLIMNNRRSEYCDDDELDQLPLPPQVPDRQLCNGSSKKDNKTNRNSTSEA